MNERRDGIILMVEDNPDDQVLIKRALKKANVVNEVVVASDGVEALDYLLCRGEHAERDPTPPAIVLLDLKLPRVDGLEVLRKIRSDKRTRLLPVVVLTSSREERDVVESYALGANGYVQKPVDFGQFAEAVKAVGCFWVLVNVKPPIRAPEDR